MWFVSFQHIHNILLTSIVGIITGDWKCHDGGFKCVSGDISCINSTLICDKFQHCSDASDEKSCGKLTLIRLPQHGFPVISAVEYCSEVNHIRWAHTRSCVSCLIISYYI